MVHKSRKTKEMLQTVAAILFWLAVWQFAAFLLHKPILLVGPVQVAKTMFGLAKTAVFWQTVLNSLLHMIGGFLAALLVGVLLAAAAARFSGVRILLSPLMLTVKSVPVASFIILVLLWLKSARHLSLVISFIMVLPILYTHVLAGICSVDTQLLQMAGSFHMPLRRRLVHIYAPGVLPQFRAACTVALGLCWKSGVAAEVIGVTDGSIGGALYSAKITLSTAEVLAWSVVIIAVSLLFEKLFMRGLAALEKRGASWI